MTMICNICKEDFEELEKCLKCGSLVCGQCQYDFASHFTYCKNCKIIYYCEGNQGREPDNNKIINNDNYFSFNA